MVPELSATTMRLILFVQTIALLVRVRRASVQSSWLFFFFVAWLMVTFSRLHWMWFLLHWNILLLVFVSNFVLLVACFASFSAELLTFFFCSVAYGDFFVNSLDVILCLIGIFYCLYLWVILHVYYKVKLPKYLWVILHVMYYYAGQF